MSLRKTKTRIINPAPRVGAWINNKAFISLIFSLFVLLLAASIWLFFPVSSSGVHYYSIGLYILLLLGIAIFISYKKDLSIPIVKTVLKREYYRIKFKYDNKQGMFIRAYLKVLYYLILLFKSSEDSFETLREDVLVKFSKSIEGIKREERKQPIFVRICLNSARYFILLFKSSEDNLDLFKEDIFIKSRESIEREKEERINDEIEKTRQTIEKIKSGDEVDKDSLHKLEKELFEFSKFKQKKATVFSLTVISAIIIVTVASGLISSFLFPEVFKIRAASYGFVQTSWSGGSSTATALHPGDQTIWNKYFSKDNVSTSTPGELSLDFEDTAIWSETSDADWNTHATSSTYYSSDSVGILRPNGATCSATIECSSGFCVDGVCCDTACTGSTCQVCDSDSSGGAGTCGYIDTVSDPDNECSTASPGSSDSCKSPNCSGAGYSCGYLAAGEQNQPACKTCSGASYDPTNISDDTGDGEGSNKCDATSGDCYRCSGGSCTYQTVAQDLFTECTASGCTATGNCSGAGYSCGGNVAADTQVSGCNSICQYCDGSGSCKGCIWTVTGNQNGCVLSGVTKSCRPSVVNSTAYFTGGNCNNAKSSKTCSGGSWVSTVRCDCN